MKKLLLIEDSKLFAKAISRQLAVNNYFEVHHAATRAEMMALLAENTYFVAIADLILPDASFGEVVYSLIGRDIPVISLTGSVDGHLQSTIKALPIVDYVVKESRNDVVYAVRLAEMMLFTQGMKVLVACGTEERSVLMDHLQPYRFRLTCVTALDEAVREVDRQADELGLIVCDQYLADADGLQLVSQIRKQYDQLSLPILYVSDDLGATFDARLLKSGVNDFVTRPFSREELTSRLVTQLSSRIRYRQIQDYADTVDRYIITSSTDEFGIIRSVSQAFCDISGYSREELVGRDHNIVRHPDMKHGLYKELWQTIKSGKSWRGEMKNRSKDGSAYWVDVFIEPVFDAMGAIVGYTAIRQDITDKKQIETLSVTDPMTGLYNRRHFNQAFKEIAQAISSKKQQLAFLIFDVDHFKNYNDHYGHQAGDHVLTAIGKTVHEMAGSLKGYAYRLGGEEFALLFGVRSSEKALHEAIRLQEAIEALGIAHDFNSASSYVTASFGLCLREENHDISEMYKAGDALLYQAKESGRNRVATEKPD